LLLMILVKLMNAIVKLDFSIKYVQKYGMGALLTSVLLHKQYMDAKKCGSVGPEGFAEWWFSKNLRPRILSFENLVLDCFLQILKENTRG